MFSLPLLIQEGAPHPKQGHWPAISRHNASGEIIIFHCHKVSVL